jgi:hypothetical protein
MPFTACLQNRESRDRGIFPECDLQYTSMGSSRTDSQGRFEASGVAFEDVAEVDGSLWLLDEESVLE